MARVVPPRGEASALVQRVIREAKQRSGKSAALAAKIAPLLGGFVYGESAISAWISGRDRPSAEVLLAAAMVTQISLDEYLYGKSLGEEMRLLADRVRQLEDQDAPWATGAPRGQPASPLIAPTPPTIHPWVRTWVRFAGDYSARRDY